MTSIGPLTTTFSAPSSCTTNTPRIYQIHTGKEYNYVQGPLFKPGSDCFPSGYVPSPSAYYSPGVCPQGYTPACTNLLPIQTALAPATETAYICCPTALSYTCVGKDENASLGCTTSFSRVHGVIGATVIKDGVTGDYGVFTESEGGFAAHSIQVRFQEGPRIQNVPQVPQDSSSQTTTASTTTTTTLSGTSQRTTVATISMPIQTSQTETTPPAVKTETKTEGVSTGAAIGIAIGSAIAGILLVGLVALFFFLRWRRKRKPPPVPPKEPSLSVRNTPTVQPPYELSEESARRTRSRRLRMLSRRTRPSTRRDPVPQVPQLKPAELEAAVPSDSSNMSISDSRSNLESSTGGWTIRQQREGVLPTPWI